LDVLFWQIDQRGIVPLRALKRPGESNEPVVSAGFSRAETHWLAARNVIYNPGWWAAGADE
jgi:hypothetical protein